MQENKPMYKIYSRRRLNIFNFKKHKNGTIERKIKTTRLILVIFIIAFLICFFIWRNIEPVFNDLCVDEAKVIATKIANEEATKVLSKYSYSDLFKIEKDDSGEIQLVGANVLVINKISSDISMEVQKSIENYEGGKIKLPLGILSGSKLLSGYLPEVKIKIATAGNVETDLKSEFISQSTTQTLHRVYLQIICNVNVITPYEVIKSSIQNQILLLENVIIGDFGTMGTLPIIQN